MEKKYSLQLFFLTILHLFAICSHAQVTSNVIDETMAKQFSAYEIVTSDIISDEEFIRRLSLDVRGVIPSIEEVVEFLNDENENKRSDLITKFLNDEQYGTHWANYWDKVLVGTLQQPQGATAQLRAKQDWKNWVAESFNSNRPYTDFVQEIVSAEGEYPHAPEVFPLSRWRNAPESQAGTISRAFLGQNIQCAQCHDHKTQPGLTQEKFWEFASFFSNTRVVPVMNNMGEDRMFSIVVRDAGLKWEHKVQDSDMVVVPTYLNGEEAEQQLLNEDGSIMSRKDKRQMLKDLRAWNQSRKEMQQTAISPLERGRALTDSFPQFQDTRRDQLAKMMIEFDQEQVARNFVNRVWARYFGTGIIDPVDAWIDESKGLQSETLEMLTHDFIKSGFNVKALEWTILNSETYQRSVVPTINSQDIPALYAQAFLRPLSPEQILDSLFAALSIPEPEDTEGFFGRMDQALYDRYYAQFVSTIGNDEMEWSNTFETSVPKMLFLLNDKGIQKGISDTPGNIIDRIHDKSSDPEGHIDYLYLATLSRMPTEVEKKPLVEELTTLSQKNKKQVRQFEEDLLWALLNSTEFVTNH